MLCLCSCLGFFPEVDLKVTTGPLSQIVEVVLVAEVVVVAVVELVLKVIDVSSACDSV